MNPELLAQCQAKLAEIERQVTVLAHAVEAADLYLNSFDTSAPSRIKAETRLAVEEAMALVRPRS
jgi:hypothetical protein